ncbi:hypothetical protein CTEN210_13657 [Chaetoceros tenuissimus]|uniref:Leucine-rich repeat domain-containing protein n=1 Tax=Chaetoceros tenuissimus TaxID=426638 RepID=A0AAD3HBF8_9STRA|nr:hypothetical protein CTEN210_13657 [Chaetoceros tenuissimus]
MRVQTEEWRRFIPGVRMYKGKKTLFYNREILWGGDEFGHPLIYDEEERDSWEVIIILPGVEIIPEFTFCDCKNIETVIMADTVRRIEEGSFRLCEKVHFVKLSTSLEYIGESVFQWCKSLISIFIPPSCRQIDECAFMGCHKLIIFHVPQNTELGNDVIVGTKLIHASPIVFHDHEEYNIETNNWIKNINNEEQYALHRACSCFNPLEDIIYEIVQREGSLEVFNRKNSIGITPSQYLEANPYAKVTEQKIINRFVLEIMGEL